MDSIRLIDLALSRLANIKEDLKLIKQKLHHEVVTDNGLTGTVSCKYCNSQKMYWGNNFTAIEHTEDCPITLLDKVLEQL